MGLCLSTNEKELKRQNDEIEKQIRRDKILTRKEVKLLLLGAGGSGKSTIVKQMRIIHGEGYNQKDLLDYKQLIHSQIVINMQTLLDAMSLLNIEIAEDENKKHFESFKTISPSRMSFLESAMVEAMNALWKDSGVQKCFERRREYQLNDSAEYYFESMARIGDVDAYVPNEQDVLRVRVPTTGIVEYKFNISNIIFRMVDVGGQRSERPLSEYDQVLFEDENQNRMRESMALFDNICNYKWFEQTSIILFLNKTDLFTEKIKKSKLSDYFPEYNGDEKDFEEGKNFILEMFAHLNRNEEKPLYPHFTTATDTENIKFVFAAVKDTILQNNLKDYGLV